MIDFPISRANKYPKASGHYHTSSNTINVICQCGQAATLLDLPKDTPGFSKYVCSMCGRTWTAILTVQVEHGAVI